MHDLGAAYTAFGYFDDQPPAELVARREILFERVAEAHHYNHVRRLVACVPSEILALTPAEIALRYRSDPLSLTRDPDA